MVYKTYKWRQFMNDMFQYDLKEFLMEHGGDIIALNKCKEFVKEITIMAMLHSNQNSLEELTMLQVTFCRLIDRLANMQANERLDKTNIPLLISIQNHMIALFNHNFDHIDDENSSLNPIRSYFH